MLKKALLLAALAASAFAGNITVKGSDTMVLLAQRWAEKYMQSHPGTKIQVTGGGSGTGIAALINGSTDICTSSRPMKGSEKEGLKSRYNTMGVEVRAAKDGIALYANPRNPVQALTLDQIKGIYTGQITNWSQVGGPNARIIVYGRENSSGTYVYFRDAVLGGKNYVTNMQSLPGTAAVVNAVARDANAIGFGGAAYAKGIKEIGVKRNANAPAYVPNAESIKSGAYPITRYLYMYLRNRPTGELKDFIDWTLSSEGQNLAVRVGYFPAR